MAAARFVYKKSLAHFLCAGLKWVTKWLLLNMRVSLADIYKPMIAREFLYGKRFTTESPLFFGENRTAIDAGMQKLSRILTTLQIPIF